MPFFHHESRALTETEDMPQGNSIESPARARYSVLFAIDNSGPKGDRSRLITASSWQGWEEITAYLAHAMVWIDSVSCCYRFDCWRCTRNFDSHRICWYCEWSSFDSTRNYIGFGVLEREREQHGEWDRSTTHRRSTHLDQVEWVAYWLSLTSRRSGRTTSLRVVRLHKREWPMIVQIRMYSSLPLHTCHRFLKKRSEDSGSSFHCIVLIPSAASLSLSHRSTGHCWHNSNRVNASRPNWIREVCVCSHRKAPGRRHSTDLSAHVCGKGRDWIICVRSFSSS